MSTRKGDEKVVRANDGLRIKISVDKYQAC